MEPKANLSNLMFPIEPKGSPSFLRLKGCRVRPRSCVILTWLIELTARSNNLDALQRRIGAAQTSPEKLLPHNELQSDDFSPDLFNLTG